MCILSSSLPLLAACAWMVAGEGGTIMLENRAPKIFLGVFLAISVAPALAHDPSHPELNGWFDKLASGRGLCCSDADGTGGTPDQAYFTPLPLRPAA